MGAKIRPRSREGSTATGVCLQVEFFEALECRLTCHVSAEQEPRKHLVRHKDLGAPDTLLSQLPFPLSVNAGSRSIAANPRGDELTRVILLAALASAMTRSGRLSTSVLTRTTHRSR